MKFGILMIMPLLILNCSRLTGESGSSTNVDSQDISEELTNRVDTLFTFSEGDAGYPSDASQTRIFGVTVGNAPRAYNMSALSRHEIFNDKIDGEPYIVAY